MKILTDSPYSICCSPSGCLSALVSLIARGVAVGQDLFQPFRLSSRAATFGDLPIPKGAVKKAVGLYMFWRAVPPDGANMSLKGSDISTVGHRPTLIPPIQSPSSSLKGSYRFTNY